MRTRKARRGGAGLLALRGLVLCAAALGLPGAAEPGTKRHPTVATGASCVTRECHAGLTGPDRPATGGSIHQPAADGECGSCHDLALSPGVRYVKGAPTAGDEIAEKARAWDVALCTECHGESLLMPAPPGATGFADGTRNLHALHLQAGRGRRCLSCHHPHLARQPRLLRDLIPARGGATAAQEFRQEPNGGWCRTGCHAPKSYRRPPR